MISIVLTQLRLIQVSLCLTWSVSDLDVSVIQRRKLPPVTWRRRQSLPRSRPVSTHRPPRRVVDPSSQQEEKPAVARRRRHHPRRRHNPVPKA